MAIDKRLLDSIIDDVNGRFVNANGVFLPTFSYRQEDRAPVLVSSALLAPDARTYIALCFDFSELKSAGEELRRMEARYHALFNSAPLACLVLEAYGQIVDVNEHAAATFGYAREALLGRQVGDLLIHREERTSMHELLSTALDEPGQCHRWLLRVVCCDGEMRWVDTVLRVIRDEDGETRVLAVGKDVTDTRRMREQLSEYRERLKMLAGELMFAEERERRRIAMGLHDEVDQSLATARMQLTSLPRESLPPEAWHTIRAACRLIDEAIRRTRSLTFELSSPVLYTLGLEPAIESLAEAFEATHGIRVRITTAGPHTPLAVELRVVLYRAVRELLFNVAKHAGADRADINIERSETRLNLSVVDDGVGPSADEAGEALASNRGFGYLSLREQLDHVGGHLEVNAARGRGTRVTVNAPVVYPPPESRRDDPVRGIAAP